MPQICDMGPTALLPFQTKACWGIFRPQKSWWLRPGLNPQTWVIKGCALPLDHQSCLRCILHQQSALTRAIAGSYESNTTNITVGKEKELNLLLILMCACCCLKKIYQASFRETCQRLKFPLNGLWAQSRVSRVVGLLPLASGPACLGMAFPPFLVKQLYRCDLVVISPLVSTGYTMRKWEWLLGMIGYSITHHYPLYVIWQQNSRLLKQVTPEEKQQQRRNTREEQQDRLQNKCTKLTRS